MKKYKFTIRFRMVRCGKTSDHFQLKLIKKVILHMWEIDISRWGRHRLSWFQTSKNQNGLRQNPGNIKTNFQYLLKCLTRRHKQRHLDFTKSNRHCIPMYAVRWKNVNRGLLQEMERFIRVLISSLTRRFQFTENIQMEAHSQLKQSQLTNEEWALQLQATAKFSLWLNSIICKNYPTSSQTTSLIWRPILDPMP